MAGRRRKPAGRLIAVEGTRVLMRLRSEITTAMDARLLIYQTDDLDQNSSGTFTGVAAGNAVFQDFQWAANAYTVGSLGTPTAAETERYPTFELTGALARLGGPSARFRLMRLTSTGALDVDIVRYGRL